MSFLRRGAAGLALTALVAAGLVPGAHADNLEVPGDQLSAGSVDLGTVCRGEVSPAEHLRFNIRRSGGTNKNAFGNNAVVTVTGSAASSPRGTVALGSTSKTTPEGWVGMNNNTLLDAGTASVAVSVPAGAALGDATSTVTWTASGPSALQGETANRTTTVGVSWTVVDCAPADTTPPAISYELDPAQPDGTNGWYRTDVAVDWTVADGESAITEQGCVDTTVATDGTHVLSCTAASEGGAAAPVEVVVKRDTVAPSVTPTVRGQVGEDGWYVGDVQIGWTITDATSGFDAGSCPTTTLAEDTRERTFTCTVVDHAGNQAEASVTVARDATDPVITSTVTGPLGHGDWYVGDVEVAWDVADATSEVATTSGCGTVTVGADTDGTSYTCSAVDHAGNDTSRTVTVKRDATGPTITFTRSGDEGDNGWYVGPVDLAWTVTDEGGSGMAGTEGCGSQAVTEDGEHEFTCRATDAAGNPAQATARVDKDATAPVVLGTASGDEGDNGWFTSDVAVTWDVSDATSGLDDTRTTGCGPATVSQDTKGETFTCVATDRAGNSSSDALTVKRDTTAPTIAPVVQGTLGDNDWYVGDVNIGWAITDATSGAVAGEECLDATLTTDTGGQRFTCAVTDGAGNRADSSTEVRRDATRPVITSSVRGTAGGGDWFTSDVEVAWTVTDATSGVVSSQGCETAQLTEDSAGTTYTCSARDGAGNADSRSVTVKRDATAPTVSYTRSGDEGDNGWYVGPVDVDWTIGDTGSGVATVEGCEDARFTTDGTHVTTCTVTDVAGNQAQRAGQVLLDATAPTVTGSVAGTEGDNGWYVDNATVTWLVADTTSGVDDTRTSGCVPSTVSRDTTGETFTCVATDRAGNSAGDTITVKRDATDPEVTFTGGPADGSSYHFGDPVPGPSTCSATDATSGVTGAGCTVTGGGTTVGLHTQTGSATDLAGNTGTTTRSYRVLAWTLDGFYKPVAGEGVVNTVKAGSTVPLKFNVLKGTTPLTSDIGATFAARKVGCDGSDIVSSVDEFTTTGGTSLRYDATSGQWVQNWATPAGGKGACYRVILTTADGSATSAVFRLR